MLINKMPQTEIMQELTNGQLFDYLSTCSVYGGTRYTANMLRLARKLGFLADRKYDEIAHVSSGPDLYTRVQEAKDQLRRDVASEQTRPISLDEARRIFRGTKAAELVEWLYECDGDRDKATGCYLDRQDRVHESESHIAFKDMSKSSSCGRRKTADGTFQQIRRPPQQ